jgi:hypothetical protein
LNSLASIRSLQRRPAASCERTASGKPKASAAPSFEGDPTLANRTGKSRAAGGTLAAPARLI